MYAHAGITGFGLDGMDKRLPPTRTTKRIQESILSNLSGTLEYIRNALAGVSVWAVVAILYGGLRRCLECELGGCDGRAGLYSPREGLCALQTRPSSRRHQVTIPRIDRLDPVLPSDRITSTLNSRCPRVGIWGLGLDFREHQKTVANSGMLC